jgi:hypothetical protein
MVALAQRVFEGMQTQKPGYTEYGQGNLRRQTAGRNGIAGSGNGSNGQGNQAFISSAYHPCGGFRGRGRGYGQDNRNSSPHTTGDGINAGQGQAKSEE